MRGRFWTDSETCFFLENYGKIPIVAIAKEVGRIEKSVRAKARKIGLVSKRKFAVTISCEVCGKEFKRSPSAISYNKHQFCSRGCYYEWKKSHPNTENLGERPKGKDHYLWKEKINVKCAFCGNEFKIYPFRLNEAKYCSRKCYGNSLVIRLRGENNPYWKGGHEWYYGPNWYEQRRKVLERDNRICQLCGIPENGRKNDVHHIAPFREFGLERYEDANKLENLMTLCHSCHMNLENMGVIK